MKTKKILSLVFAILLIIGGWRTHGNLSNALCVVGGACLMAALPRRKTPGESLTYQ